MINKLVWENLKHRWVRTFLCALVVGVQVMLILTLIGLSQGIMRDTANRQKGTGADIFMKPDTGATFSLSSGQLLEKYVDFVAKQPHVKQAVGVLSANVETITTINGTDIPQFEKISTGFRLLAGGLPATPDDLIVDRYYAQQHKLKIGDTIKLLNHNWRVCGIIEGGMLGRLVVQLRRLQELTGNATPPRISEILVKLDNSARTDQEVARLNELLKGNLKAISTEEMISQLNISNIPQLRNFITVVIFLAVIVGFLVVFLSMYTAVVERTREIGILKALGAKPKTIIDILVREAILLALAGCLIGIALSFGAKALIMTLMPASLQVITVPEWWPYSALIALTGALLGAIYPGLKAARQDAIEALAYE